MSIRRIVLIAVLLSFAVYAPSQTTAPTGRQMIDRAVAALGGDKFLHMQNRVERGHIYGFFHGELSGLEVVTMYVSYLPGPPAHGLALQERELLGKKRDYSYLFLPDRAYDVTFRGARPIPDEDWARYLRSNRNDILYILRCRLNEPGLQFDYMGSDVYVSRHVEIVEVTDSSDQVVRVYFDHNTMLPMHETYSWFDEKTREHNDEAIDYDKYRDAGNGVMWPWVIERERNGYKSYQMFAENAQVNQSVPPTMYELPAGAKLLKAVQ